MKTDDLISALAADATPRGPSLRTGLAFALVAAVVIAALVMDALLGPRSDAWASLFTSPRFVFKFVITATLAGTALVVSLRLARPGARPPLALLAAPALLLAGAVALELWLVPESLWLTRLVGSNWLICLTLAPLISLGPLVVLLVAFRRGAPENPTRAGLVAGLAAAGIGTFFYAAHCPDDSPLFVATWYSIVAAMMAGLGAAIGSRVLRW